MRKARITKNHSKPVTWCPEPQSQNATYVSVVHGSRKKPSSGTIQLSKARLRMSSKIHSRNRTNRGEISASSASRQATEASLSNRAVGRQVGDTRPEVRMTIEAQEGISTDELRLAARNSGMPLEALR